MIGSITMILMALIRVIQIKYPQIVRKSVFRIIKTGHWGRKKQIMTLDRLKIIQEKTTIMLERSTR